MSMTDFEPTSDVNGGVSGAFGDKTSHPMMFLTEFLTLRPADIRKRGHRPWGQFLFFKKADERFAGVQIVSSKMPEKAS